MSSIFEPETRIVHVYKGDFQDRIARLERRVLGAAKAAEGDTVMLDETPEHLALAAEYDALAAEAEKHRVALVVMPLPRRISKVLRAAHPPRKFGDDGVTELQARGDMLFGVNEETFKDALIRGGVVDIDGRAVPYRSVALADSSVEDLDDLASLTEDDFDALSEGAFTALYAAAMDLTYGFSSDPKEGSLVSRLTQRSDKT